MVSVREELLEVRLFPVHIQGCGVGINLIEEKSIRIVFRLQNMKQMAVRLVARLVGVLLALCRCGRRSSASRSSSAAVGDEA